PPHLPRYDDDRPRDPPPPGSSYRDSYFHPKRKRDDEQDYYSPHHGYADQEHHHRESFASSFDSYDNDRSHHNPYGSQHHRPLSPRQRASTPPPPPPPPPPSLEVSNRYYGSPHQRNGHYQQNFSSKRPRSMSPDQYNNQHERPYTNNKYHNQHKYPNQNKYLGKSQIKYNPNYRPRKLSFNKFHHKHNNNANLQPQYLPFDNNNSSHHHHRHYPSASNTIPPAQMDTVQDEAARQRVIHCFDDTIFISTANFADHYQEKYGRRIILNDFRPFTPFFESVPITGDSQIFLRRVHPSIVLHLSRRQPMNSLRIMRNRLARLCSSVVTKLAVKDMYIHVYGRRPDFPLIVDDDIDSGERKGDASRDREEQDQGQEKPKQTINDWDELLRLVPLDRKYLEEVRAPALWDDEDDPTAKLIPLIVKVPDPEWSVCKSTSSDREEDVDEVEEDDDETMSPSELSRHHSATSSATPTPTRETDAVRDQQDEVTINQDVGSSDRRPPPPLSSDHGLIAVPHLQTSSSPYTSTFPPTPASSSPLPSSRRVCRILSAKPAPLKPILVPETTSVEPDNLFETNTSKAVASAALDPSNQYRENEREPGELGEPRNPGEPGEPEQPGELGELAEPGELGELVESPEADSPSNPASDLHMMKLKIMKLFEDVMFVALSSLPWHYERKYGQSLDVPGRLSQWVYQHFPTALNQVRFHDLDPSTLFLTLARHPPTRLTRRIPPNGPPPPLLPYTILRARLARLCFTHNSNAAVFYRMYTTAYGQLSPQQFPMPIKRRPSSTSPVSQQGGTHWARADSWEDLLRIVRAEIGGRGSGWWGASEFRSPPLYGDEEKILETDERVKDVLGEVKLVHECRRPGLGSRWLEFVGSDGWRVDWGGKSELGDEGIVEMDVDKDEEEESAEGPVHSSLLATNPDTSLVAVEREKIEEFERAKDKVRMKAAEFERESKSRAAEVEQAKDEPRTKVVESERSRDECKARDEYKMDKMDKMEGLNMPPQPPAVPRVHSLTERQRLMLQLMFQVNNVLPYPKRKMIDL
ncbi:hypothetical protein BC937DRAFT_94511, partial [Endogone sp. FLAS-F59071]